MKHIILVLAPFLFLNIFTKCTIFFNPLISEVGIPYCYKNNLNEGIIGWLDIVPHLSIVRNKNKIINFDRVMVLRCCINNQVTYKFISPNDPNIQIPCGLYCWQSSWKNYIHKEHIFYAGLHTDFCMINRFIAEKKSSVPLQANPYCPRFCYDIITKNWKYHNPKDKTVTIYTENKLINRLNCDFNGGSLGPKFAVRKQFYDIMGVTETYMREFLGAESDQFEVPIIYRKSIKIPNIRCPKLLDYFPAKLQDCFSNRDILSLSGTCKLYCLEDFYKNKTIKNNLSNRAKIILVDKNLTNYDLNQEYSFIQLIQMQPKYYDAVFHVFTAFDGFENHLGNCKSLIEDIPLELLSTSMGNLIFRKYYQASINLLENLEKSFDIKNGHINKIKNLTPEALNKIKFMYFSDVKIVNPICLNQKIDYVFTGILCLCENRNFKNAQIQAILENALKSALSATAFNRKKKIIFNLQSLEYFGYKIDFIIKIFTSEFFEQIIKDLALEVILIKPENTKASIILQNFANNFNSKSANF